MRQTIEALERRTQLEKVRDDTAEQFDRLRSRLAPLDAQRADARSARRRFESALSQVYAEPKAVRREFEARARQNGYAATAAEMGRYPERFGQLRGTQVGPVRSPERNQGLRAAGRLKQPGAEHLHSMRQTAVDAAEYNSLTSAVSRVQQRLTDLDSELARGPGASTLRHQLNRQLRALGPVERRALRRSLPIPHRHLVTAALIAARSFAHEQGRER